MMLRMAYTYTHELANSNSVKSGLLFKRQTSAKKISIGPNLHFGEHCMLVIGKTFLKNELA